MVPKGREDTRDNAADLCFGVAHEEHDDIPRGRVFARRQRLLLSRDVGALFCLRIGLSLPWDPITSESAIGFTAGCPPFFNRL